MSKFVEIELVPVERLKHIEGHSKKRVEWLVNKIKNEGVWRLPIALDSEHDLVLDGQHRMEVAIRLGLKRVPAVRYVYSEVDVWSLRANHSFDWQKVTERAFHTAVYLFAIMRCRS